MVKKILIFFISWKTLAYGIAFLASFILPLQREFTPFVWDVNTREFPYLIWIWGNFDGTHYMEIARNGYHTNEHAFFPLFPVLIGFFHSFFNKINIPYLIAGQLVSNISFLLSLFLLVKILAIDKKSSLLTLLFLVIIFFPTSFFYAAVYNDSLFFLLAVLTIYFSRKQSWFLASITAGLATLTRLNGLALIFLILFEYIALSKGEHVWKVQNIVSSFIRNKMYSICTIPLAFLGYLLYTHIKYGSWHLIFTSIGLWNQDKITFPIQVFFRYLKILFATLSGAEVFHITFLVAVFELFSVLFYISMLIYSFKKIRLSYWLFFAISILIPSLTGTFQGMPRYGLHIYPFFLSIALFLEHKPPIVKVVYFLVSLALFFFSIALFTRGYFVS